ncbi:hypothetical protein FVQ89_00340 [Homoserinibacter sp. GY 40078]|nr:hypothetical protein FVQ89_00340 [Homoserinibacter sp. GY 40078]
MFSFFGRAEIDGISVPKWIAATFDRQWQTNEEALRRLLDRLNREVRMKERFPLYIVGVVIDRDLSGTGTQMAVFQTGPYRYPNGSVEFPYQVKVIREITHFAGGSGGLRIRESEKQEVLRVVGVNSKPKDVARLLARVNRSTALRMTTGAGAGTVGPAAMTAYLPFSGTHSVGFEVHVEKFTKPFQPVMPWVVHIDWQGLGSFDFTSFMEEAEEYFKAVERGEIPEED